MGDRYQGLVGQIHQICQKPIFRTKIHYFLFRKKTPKRSILWKCLNVALSLSSPSRTFPQGALETLYIPSLTTARSALLNPRDISGYMGEEEEEALMCLANASDPPPMTSFRGKLRVVSRPPPIPTLSPLSEAAAVARGEEKVLSQS